jgi:hypothetical protein
MSTRPLLRAALASSRAPDLLAQLARALLNGFWLGVLSDERLRELDELYYAREEVYRTAAWNERGLFAWEREVIDTHFAGARRVAVAACGGGREVLALREAGYDAVGYEPHPGLVAFARDLLASRGHPDSVHASPRDVFPAGEPCDGIVVGWGAYSLIHGRARRIAFLRGARSRLEDGAPLLVSCFVRPVLGRELQRTVALADRLRMLAGRREPLELGDTLAPNRVRVFTLAQVIDEATAAGFEVRSHALVGQQNTGTDYVAVVLAAS